MSQPREAVSPGLVVDTWSYYVNALCTNYTGSLGRRWAVGSLGEEPAGVAPGGASAASHGEGGFGGAQAQVGQLERRR